MDIVFHIFRLASDSFICQNVTAQSDGWKMLSRSAYGRHLSDRGKWLRRSFGVALVICAIGGVDCESVVGVKYNYKRYKSRLHAQAAAGFGP